ncbi:MAG TPA: hypothetical protein VF644_04945 [Pyrinomonadaceae bacterium]|jgi:hypothetical protein
MKTATGLSTIRLIKLIALVCLAIFFITVTIGGRYFSGARSIAESPQPLNESPNAAATPLPPTISPQLPNDVNLPSQLPPGIPFQFFDDFSWRSFVALVWPAQQGQRGVPDTTKTVGDAGPLVFETFKADWEVFQPNGAQPSNWNSYSGTNPCGNVTPQFGDMILASFSKFSNLGQAGFGNLVGPLVAQNNTYVRYQAAFDQIGYSQILGKQWYLKANLGTPTPANPLVFNNGSINLKSAWIDMTNIPHPERYYTRTAWLYDLVSQQCSQKTVGLVGLHIVVKTPMRPQWIWASFEQVDGIPETGAHSPYTFNDGSETAMPVKNPITYPPPTTPPTKFNVTRTMPITDSTMQTNAVYQQALKNKGSGVWQYYQLVMTQWPTPGNTPTNPGSPPFTIPGSGLSNNTSFANVTMETFFQANVSTSCMACHNVIKNQTDFNWTLNNHAFSPTNPLTPLALGDHTPVAMTALRAKKAKQISPELQQLKAILEQGRSRPPTPKVKPKPSPKPVKKKP